MVTATDALTFVSVKWETKEGEAECQETKADLVCH